MNADQQKNGMAITSLVLGILSVVCLGLLAGIPAIITGHMAHNRARKFPEQYTGAGMAIAGFIMGYFSLLVSLLLAGLLLPALAQAKNKAQSIHCMNNMKQIGLAFRIWAGDNNDQFPFNVSTKEGGTMELMARGAEGFDPNAARHFQVLSNELATPKILVCPADSSKQPAIDFQNLQPANASYQLRSGPNISDGHPAEELARCPIHQHVLTCDGAVSAGRRR